MATLKELRNERLRKLQVLKEKGFDAYPAKANRTHQNRVVVADFDKLQGQSVTVAGRITGIRKFGKIAFIALKDASGSLQLFLKEDILTTSSPQAGLIGIEDIALLDSGDFVEARGQVIKTQTGEISLEAKTLRLLTKSLRPMPNSYDGFSNKEERLRRRYIDTNLNKEVYERYLRRSRFWQASRQFLLEKGFSEMNVPVLEHSTGGADAKPFVTHMDALDQDFYLRISQELPLKRLIGGGYEKVFDIGPRFRNENYTDEHLPEHIAMEWYQAYADWQDGIKLTTEMFRYVLNAVYGKLQFKINGFEVDLSQDWSQKDYATLMHEKYSLDVFNCSLEEVKKLLTDNKLEVEKADNISRGIDKLWKNLRKNIAGPIWLVNVPLFISPLAKTDPTKPQTVQRFQAIIGGSELANGFSELNDPIEQLNRFAEQQKMRDGGDEEAMMLDIDYVEMLEYGMPPTCGLGISERVFWTFEGVTAREGVPFPQLRLEADSTTKGFYPEVFAPKSDISHGRSSPQDFSKRIVAVVNKELEPWRVTNAVAHMNAIIGSMVDKEQLVSGDYFVSQDGEKLPRNPQYPIIIMRADEKELHKIYTNVRERKLKHHVFIKEMQDTTNDQEIINTMREQTIEATTFYGIAFFAPNEIADELTKNLQLWK
jgi:lysyl-tRNA synthetase class 2